MGDTVQSEILRKIGELKAVVAGQEGFYENPDLRGIYVILLTAEGAVMFDDVRELSEICLAFCKRKEKENVQNN